MSKGLANISALSKALWIIGHLNTSSLDFVSDCFFILIAPISCHDLSVSEKSKHPTEEKEGEIFYCERQRSQFGQYICYAVLECCFVVSKVITLSFPELLFCLRDATRTRTALLTSCNLSKTKRDLDISHRFSSQNCVLQPRWRASFTSKMVNTELQQNS